MTEARGPEQINSALDSVWRTLRQRDEEHLRGNIGVIQGTFPQIVEDGQRLWDALSADDLTDLLYSSSESPPEVSHIIDVLSIPQCQDDFPDDVSALRASPNAGLYGEISERYSIGFNRQRTFLEEGLRTLFEATFQSIMELSGDENGLQQSSEVPNS